jgi:hypothetical protein
MLVTGCGFIFSRHSADGQVRVSFEGGILPNCLLAVLGVGSEFFETSPFRLRRVPQRSTPLLPGLTHFTYQKSANWNVVNPSRCAGGARSMELNNFSIKSRVFALSSGLPIFPLMHPS